MVEIMIAWLLPFACHSHVPLPPCQAKSTDIRIMLSVQQPMLEQQRRRRRRRRQRQRRRTCSPSCAAPSAGSALALEASGAPHPSRTRGLLPTCTRYVLCRALLLLLTGCLVPSLPFCQPKHGSCASFDGHVPLGLEPLLSVGLCAEEAPARGGARCACPRVELTVRRRLRALHVERCSCLFAKQTPDVHPCPRMAIDSVSAQGTFGQGDLSVCPLGGFTGVHELFISGWRGVPQGSPQEQTLRAHLLRGTSANEQLQTSSQLRKSCEAIITQVDVGSAFSALA